ncbi:MAG: transglycosylase domain-containing protein [Nitrospirales bacterium]
MFVHRLIGPIRKPLGVFASRASIEEQSLPQSSNYWVGGEGIPGNTAHITRWRLREEWLQWIRPPYQTRSLIFLAILTGLCWIVLELQTSWLQAKIFHHLSSTLTYRLVTGPANSIAPASSGPLDERQGYNRLPVILKTLQRNGFVIQAQAQASPGLMKLATFDLPVVYQEKAQSGLLLMDQHDLPLYRFITPNKVFSEFESIPPLLVKTLLFIENRELLDPCCPYANPALEWDRLGQAFISQGIRVVQGEHHVPGASTLATQLEKFRHSPGGQTASIWEKARQVTAASLRIYQEDVRTLDAQKELILRYFNSFPMGAYPGVGEIHGFGDGLWIWYGTDLTTLQEHLSSSQSSDTRQLSLAGIAYKKGLSLLLALRRPAYYLHDINALNEKTNLYLRLLTEAGIVPSAFKDIGLQTPLVFTPPIRIDFHEMQGEDSKATNFVRRQLQHLLGIPSLYDLDHLDMSVLTTLDHPLQTKAANLLNHLSDSTFIAHSELSKPHLLSQGNPDKIIYTMSMYERTPEGNFLRVQTDTLNQPLDMNQDSKTDLGSTAKLRTLVTYLEVIERLYQTYHSLKGNELERIDNESLDPLTRWAMTYFRSSQNRTLADMLEAALERHYSASPNERFWTGGGLHTFANFNNTHDGRTFSVREAFHQSVNLVFVRLMRDLVQYYIHVRPGSSSLILSDGHHPLRHPYLLRFTRQEGRQFLHQFYEIHHGQTPDHTLHLLMKQTHLSSTRVGMIIHSVYPDIDTKNFSQQFTQWLPSSANHPKKVHEFYQTLNPADWSLADRGYLARVHPLELFTVQFLAKHPQATKTELFQAAEPELMNVYAWLLAPHRKSAQDQRIRTMLEQDAFQDIHRDWQRLGYPFASLVPSLATSIGSSADRPSALARLMGILANDGKALPDILIQRVHFAQDTPFETILAPKISSPTQVLHPIIAQLVKRELIGVVNEGTAGRVKNILKINHEHSIAIGGKTGTGDHRQKQFAAGHRLVESQPVSRTATFVFLIENRFYGTITAQVLGPDSGKYDFTSSLPVNIFRLFAPHLKAYFSPSLEEVQIPSLKIPA